MSADGELDFLVQQQDESPTDLVRTDVNGSAAHVYTNALAIIAFVHKTILDSEPDSSFEERAKKILTLFQSLQIDGGDNNGGFFDAYDLSDLDGGIPKNAVDDVTTGNNAWLLMAIIYMQVIQTMGLFSIWLWILGNSFKAGKLRRIPQKRQRLTTQVEFIHEIQIL